MPSSEVEETHTPAVSSLRSKFERLAVDASVQKAAHRLSGGHDLLAPDPSGSRPRANSISAEQKPPVRSLRSASSSSDLKTGDRRPPPPPPFHSSQVNTPNGSASPSPLLTAAAPSAPPSPSLCSVSLEVRPTKAALLARKPPPPPPSTPRIESQAATPSTGVSALISKFGNPGSGTSPIPRSPYSNLRAVSHSSAAPTSSTSSLSVSLASSLRSDTPSGSRRSFPMDSVSSLHSPVIVQSPFDDSSKEHLPGPFGRPPLPDRSSGFTHTSSPPIDHSRGKSADSLASSSSGRSTSPAGENCSVVDSITFASRVPPPRPPPRPKSAAPSRQILLVNSVSPSSTGPPPLPARKGTSLTSENSVRSRAPPPRHRSVQESEIQNNVTSTLISGAQFSPADVAKAPIVSPPPITNKSVVHPTERKILKAHPPPPTRTIALGDKLPPARRPPSGSSSESEDDELKHKVELLPDSTRSSRQPPHVKCHHYSDAHIHIPPHIGVTVYSGQIVAVASGHHLKIYDLSQSDSPVHDLDPRALGMETKTKDFRICSMEFRPASRDSDRGCYLWIGTKDGHLFELDVRAGLVTGMKLAIHSHTITHIFRYGNSMVTLDETGKALIFSPDSSNAEPGLSGTQPRVVRIADKQEFVKILGGMLWTSTRDAAGANTGSTSRGPVIRVYDIFVPGFVGKSILPTEHLGVVTSGTILQSQPGQVFLGHEGGHVSIWALNTEDGIPKCQEVIKVSTSDVLCLEGVNDRLWVGGRKGTIAAYDVIPRPWVMTNSWMAHQKLPILKLATDTWSIEKLGKLVVYSVGRDEKLQFWDGLLGVDWIDQELLKRETEFSTFRDINTLIVSWNIDSAKPDALSGTPENVNFLHDALTSVNSPDIIAFGLQELIDLESRKMAAKSVLLGGKKRETDGTISQRVTTSYKKWYDKLILAVRLAMPPDTPYTVIHTENLVGLFSCIFVKDSQKHTLRDVALTTVKRGMGGRYGNKGGIIARFVMDDSSICFINCHLAAGQSHVRQRNADIAAFLEDKELFPESYDLQPYVNGGDGSMVLDHEMVFLSGDMNYRIDLRRDVVIADLNSENYTHLTSQDQLLKEMKTNRGFRLRSFMEGPLTFPPTYKYDRRSDEYDTSEKRRVPAWCDRVLWRSREPSRVEQLHYRRYEANVSDHRPISSAFKVTVKSISTELREPVKADLAVSWSEQEVSLLGAAYQFYLSESMI